MTKIYRTENGKRVERTVDHKKLGKLLRLGWQPVEQPKKRGRPPKAKPAEDSQDALD